MKRQVMIHLGKAAQRPVTEETLAEFAHALDLYGKKDMSGAFALLLPLARRGYAEARYWVGMMLCYGHGVTPDRARARRWYRRAAKLGHPAAMCALVHMNEGSDTTKARLAKRFALCAAAAEQGYAEGQLLLGDCYAEGTGVAQDTDMALRWYRKAAAQATPEGRIWPGLEKFPGDPNMEQSFRIVADIYAPEAQQAIKVLESGRTA